MQNPFRKSAAKTFGAALGAGGVFFELYRRSKDAEKALVSAKSARKARIANIRMLYAAAVLKCDAYMAGNLPSLLTESIETAIPNPSPADVCFLLFSHLHLQIINTFF